MKKILSLTLFLALLFSGCVQYSEHLNLDKQGSGTLTFKMGIMDIESLFDEDSDESPLPTEEGPTDAVLEERDELEEIPGITVVAARTYAEDGMDWSEITLEFESLRALTEALQSNESVPVGELSFKEQEGYLIFRRRLPALDRESAGDLGADFEEEMPLEMVNMFFAEISWVYEVTFPGKIIASNAKEENVDLKTNTIRWSHKFADLLTQETEMWAKIEL